MSTSTQTKLLEIINVILRHRGKSEIMNIDLETSLRYDIRFDSLDLAEFTVRVEAEYGIDVFEDGLLDSIQEVMQKLN